MEKKKTYPKKLVIAVVSVRYINQDVNMSGVNNIYTLYSAIISGKDNNELELRFLLSSITKTIYKKMRVCYSRYKYSNQVKYYKFSYGFV